jgi:thiol-disulfide isomerase/thioredoxin
MMIRVNRLLLSVFLLSFLTLPFFTKNALAQAALTVGDKAPELSLPSPKGDSVSLQSLRGKLVLIDFWASWCAPCVQEQPMLAAVYKKYKNRNFKSGKGFEIYGVSLDNKKERWLAAIKKSKITWTQVSDLKYWNSKAAKIYGIEALPYNLLIDENGIIIAVNLHGDELEKTLSELVQ